MVKIFKMLISTQSPFMNLPKSMVKMDRIPLKLKKAKKKTMENKKLISMVKLNRDYSVI